MLAIIPARSGSKRMPNKNGKILAGKPLIQHTLETAVQSKEITRVLFTTDSQKYRDIALEVKGVEAPFLRPPELSSDTAQAADVHFHAVDWIKNNEGREPEAFCVLLPTSPLRLEEDIDNAIALFKKKKADVVASIVRTKPLAWHLNMDGQTKKMVQLLKIDPKDAILNHQEMPTPPVMLNGSIYVIRTAPYRRSRSYFGLSTYGYEMPHTRSIDIDEVDDFLLAEALLKSRE